MWRGALGGEAEGMIIDPQSFVVTDHDRRLTAARAAQLRLERSAPRRRDRRGVRLRLAAWVTGRAIHA